jgi:predicted AAA+ superfamily ATPase
MSNWFDIARPHEDIRRGDFDEAVFAADLGDVAVGRAAEDYNNPYVFFRKTYLTNGLKGLLRDVHEKLTTGKGASIVELQTPFGGGKTHSLVTVYHYLKSGERVRELLPADIGLAAHISGVPPLPACSKNG